MKHEIRRDEVIDEVTDMERPPGSPSNPLYLRQCEKFCEFNRLEKAVSSHKSIMELSTSWKCHAGKP